MKILKRVLVFLLLVLLIMQFFAPEKNEGDVATLVSFVEETNPPEMVHEILKNTCFDCHSNVTEYPWYNAITPVNFWLNEHIKDGKKHLNFSEWGNYSLKRKEHKMEELHEEVANKEMPLDSYTWSHEDANLTPAQIDALVLWAKGVQQNYKQQLITE